MRKFLVLAVLSLTLAGCSQHSAPLPAPVVQVPPSIPSGPVLGTPTWPAHSCQNVTVSWSATETRITLRPGVDSALIRLTKNGQPYGAFGTGQELNAGASTLSLTPGPYEVQSDENGDWVTCQ